MAEERLQRRLAAILSADVVGYSRLMGLDEAGTLERLKGLRRGIVDPVIAAHSGRTVKLMGDGALVEFASAVDAVTCAIEVQKRVREVTAGEPEDNRIEFRIGINVGDVIVEGDDIYGDGVNVAARIQALAEPGGIYISRAAADQVRDKVPIKIETRGERTVKNIARPIEVFCVIAQEAGAIPVALRASGTPATAPLVVDKPSIAVLPFANMSGDPDQEYFADGIAEDIITSLSRLRGFFVIARNSTFTYKGRAADVKTVARELGVRYVVEGSVRKVMKRVRVTAQLIDGETGNHVWAERYDRELEDIFDVQDEITATIVAAIEPQLHVAEIIRAHHKTPSSLDAWELVMQAMERMSRFTEGDSRAAIALLDRAVATDPGYARAHAHRGWLTLWRAFQGWEAMGPALEEGGDSVAKALQFDADEPWVYVARSMLCLATRSGSEAVAAARKAIELNPNFAYGYALLGAANALAGDGEAGLTAIARAVRLSPRDLLRDDFDLFYAFAYFQKGDYARASDCAAEAATLRPGHVYPNIMLAASSALGGEQQRAAAALARVLTLAPAFGPAAAASQNIYVRAGDRERFMTGLERAGLTA